MCVAWALLIGSALVLPGSSGLTFQEKYDIWSQDLLPGFMIETSIVDGRRCHCKIPEPLSSTTASPPPTITTSTPPTTTITTSTPPSTTTGPSTTTTTGRSTTTTTTIPTTTSTSTSSTTVAPTTTASSTSSTTTPTTTSTTTTATTTSTSTTSTTSTTTTTKPAVSSDCGSCNKTLNFLKDGYTEPYTTYWTSPNYPDNYPDDCTCILTVNLVSAGMLVFTVTSGAHIHSSSSCSFDKLTMELETETLVYCDETVSTLSASMIKYSSMAATQTTTFTFVTSSADGNQVENGFQLNIEVDLWTAI